MSEFSCNLVLTRTFVRMRGQHMSSVQATRGMSPKRRQRLTRTLFTLGFLSLLAGALINGQVAVAGGQEFSGVVKAFNYVSVMPGDTLWNLASEHAEDQNVRDWIAEVILLNNLSSVDLVAGEKIAIP